MNVGDTVLRIQNGRQFFVVSMTSLRNQVHVKDVANIEQTMLGYI